MSSSYSPIDETSYGESAGFDPAALYNQAASPASAAAPEAAVPVQESEAPAAPELSLIHI